MTQFVYKQVGDAYEVGHYAGKDWVVESQHDTSSQAAMHTRFLNGGNVLGDMDLIVLLNIAGTVEQAYTSIDKRDELLLQAHIYYWMLSEELHNS